MRSIVRIPSLKKSFKARTTGRLNRAIKKAFIPGYGTKGMGLLTNPKRSLYNKVYNATSVDALKPLKTSSTRKRKAIAIEYCTDGFYEKQKIGWFGKKVKEQDLKPSDLPQKLEAPVTEEDNKRINTRTGYRVFVQSKINQANALFLHSITPHREKNQKDVWLDYINPRYYFGLMAYRMGEYDLAEKQLIKLVYLMPESVRLLSLIYRKEKRYSDAYLITKESQKSVVASHLYLSTLTTDDEVEKTKELSDKRGKTDKSILEISVLEKLKK